MLLNHLHLFQPQMLADMQVRRNPICIALFRTCHVRDALLVVVILRIRSLCVVSVATDTKKRVRLTFYCLLKVDMIELSV